MSSWKLVPFREGPNLASIFHVDLMDNDLRFSFEGFANFKADKIENIHALSITGSLTFYALDVLSLDVFCP